MALLDQTAADRAAVWMDGYECERGGVEAHVTFKGVVIERTGESSPADWTRLSLEATPVRGLLVHGKSIEEVVNSPEAPATGTMLEMRRAVWTPIQTDQELRGVVFAAVRSRQQHIDKAVLEGTAAELATALLLDSERRRNRERHQDLASVRQILAALARNDSTDAALANLVEDCTRNSDDGPGAVFAAIGELIDDPNIVPGRSDAAPWQTPPDAGRVQFSWASGGPVWTGASDTEAVSKIWRQALESHRVIGNEPDSGALATVSRVVAFPLEAGGEGLGVLVAGLPRGDSTLATLDRLELRASIASQGLWKRKHTKESERRNDRDLMLLEADGNAAVVLDAHGSILRMGQNASGLLKQGTPPNAEDDSPIVISRLFQPRERKRVETWLEETAVRGHNSNGSVETLDAELANGRRVQVKPFAGTQAGQVAVVLKCVDRAEGEAGERRSQTELFNIVEWLEEGVVLFDAQQHIRVMNSRFAQLTGLAAEEATDTRTLQELITILATKTAQPEPFAARWLAVAQGSERGVREEVHLLRPVPRVLERTSRPIVDLQGGLLGRVEIYRDLSAQRIFHSKLLQTEKLAAVGQMVASIAHELSNPLTSILGYAQRLLRREPAGASSEARQIFSEAERAGSIVRQLLVTGRDSQRQRTEVALNQVIARTVELQQVVEKTRFELDLDAALPPVLGDPGQLQQVLMNLIANARQAIQLAGKQGTIQVRSKSTGGTHVLVEVVDNGPGIPAAILSKIFDPFFTTKPAGVGTGLGLSIAVGIVREHGGQIRVANLLGGGASFTIELPAAPALVTRNSGQYPESAEGSDAHRQAELAAVEEGERTLAAWARMAVLVVEDEATVAQLIADVLREEGLEVDVLLDGREALRRVASEHYDLVICDMKMPDLDGEQFYRQLSRSHSALRGRVLFVTGDVLAAHTQDFLKHHALPHVAKPFRVEELTEAVRQVLVEVSPRKTRSVKSNVARN